MDTYFDRLDPRALKNESDSEDDGRDLDIINAAGDGEEDLEIYESKDPYVLRSLPYLIGSKEYLENDHVGLKDLESEEEEELQDEEETGLQKTEETSSTLSSEDDEEKQTSTKRSQDENSDDEDMFASTKVGSNVDIKKKDDNLFVESDEDHNDGIFNLGAKIVIKFE